MASKNLPPKLNFKRIERRWNRISQEVAAEEGRIIDSLKMARKAIEERNSLDAQHYLTRARQIYDARRHNNGLYDMMIDLAVGYARRM